MSEFDQDLGPETTGADSFAESGTESVEAPKSLDARSEEAVAVLRDLAYAAIGLGATALKDIGDFAGRGRKNDTVIVDEDGAHALGATAPTEEPGALGRVLGGGKDKLRELSEDLSNELQGAGENFTSFVEQARRRFDETVGKFQDTADETFDKVARLPESAKASSEKLSRDNLKATADEYLEQAFSLYRQYVERGAETAEKLGQDSQEAQERVQQRAAEGIRQATTMTEQALSALASKLGEAAKAATPAQDDTVVEDEQSTHESAADSETS